MHHTKLLRCVSVKQLKSVSKHFACDGVFCEVSNRINNGILSRSLATVHDRWIVPSTYSDVEIPNVAFTKYVFDMQENYGGRIALRSAESNQSYTHSQVREKSLRLSSAFHKLGLSKGDVIAIVSPNCPEFLFSFMASAHLGATITTVNSTYTSAEIAKQLQDSATSVVVCHFLLYNQLKEAVKECPTVRHVVLIGKEEGGTIPFHKLMKDDGKDAPQNVQVNPDEDILVLPYSSGTTGLPKGVMLSHKNIIANLQQLLHPDLLRIPLNGYREYHPEKFIGLIPMFHIYGMVACMLISLVTGGEMVTLFRFDPDQYINTIKRHKPTYLHLVPPIMSFLTFSPKVDPNLLNDVSYAVCGAAPVGPGLFDKFVTKFNNGIGFIEGYGMTEASPCTHMTPKNTFVKGSCGTGIANTITKIVDVTSGKTLGPHDGTGELCVKGPQVMKGYFKNPDATKETLTSDGWLHTGDIATMDADKNIFIVDRLKELIKVKGLQVAPAELEDVLRQHAQVQDVAVVGVPDKRSGELPKAFIVAAEGATPDAEDIMSFLAKKVAPHKKLTGGISFVKHIPKSDTGKILRRVIKQSEGIL